MKKKNGSGENWFIDFFVIIVLILFLLSYFKPNLLFMQTTTTGGDTASHYYSAYFMKTQLLPQGRMEGWTMGNYAGFPLFKFYFFLPFVLIALLGFIIPLEIAFKLVTVLGSFLLPVCAYVAMKSMRFRFPIPALASIFTIPFLFMEANSMWGGNIPSTLAGEFADSLSLALTVLFIGLLYMEIEKNDRRNYLYLVVLLVLITFTHIYTLLLAVLSSSFFLLKKDSKVLFRNLSFLFKIYVVSFLLVGFWTIPMVWRLSYTTPFAVVWNIEGIKEAFPPILAPFYVMAILGGFRAMRKGDERIDYLIFTILAAYILYVFSPWLDIVDIRFVPFIQFFPVLIAAYGFGELTAWLREQRLLPLIALVATIIWVNHNVSFIPTWIDWNYQGFEKKTAWADYNGVNQFLRGVEGDPRVVFEHSPLHNSAGSTRAFESLPLFSGRNTLEGLYMQSSISAPFVFYIQSQISKVASCPFPQWPCTTLNPAAAVKRLELFNVKHVVARSDEVKKALKDDLNYKLITSFGSYDIFELDSTQSGYVIVPGYEPVLISNERWKEVSYLWFMNQNQLDVPLVFGERDDGKSLNNLPRTPISNDCQVNEKVSHNEISFQTSCPGAPHIIRISYFPNWKVDGAEGIYLSAPSFMLVYPSSKNVRIYYGWTFIDYLGLLLTFLGVISILLMERITGLAKNTFPHETAVAFIDGLARRRLLVFVVLIVILGIVSAAYYTGQAEKRAQEDRFGMQLALASNRYTMCDSRVKDKGLKELCYKEVGIATNDYNLCDARIKDQVLRDECFKEIGVKTGDLNLCMVKIASESMKIACQRELQD